LNLIDSTLCCIVCCDVQKYHARVVLQTVQVSRCCKLYRYVRPYYQVVLARCVRTFRKQRIRRKSVVVERRRAMLHVTEYFAKPLKVAQGHSKWYHLVDHIRVPIGVP